MTTPFDRRDASVHMRAGRFYLIFYAALGAYLPFLNVYFRDSGLSGFEIGLLSAVTPAITLLAATPLSMLADRRMWRIRMLVASTIGVVIALLAFAVAGGFWGFFAAMVLYALAFGPLTPLSDSLTVGMARRHGINFGDLRMWGSLGFAAVSVIAGGIWGRTGYLPMFLVGGALYLIAAGLATRLDEYREVVARGRVDLRFITHDPFILVVLLTTFLTMAAYGMDSTFSGIYMTSLGGSGLFVGLLFGISAVFELPAMLGTGALITRFGGPRTLLLAYLLYTATYAGFIVAHHPVVLLVVCVLRGLSFGLYLAATVRLLNERTPPQWAATMQGVVNGIAFGLARLISSPIGGRAFDAFGPVSVYVLCCGCSAAAALIMAVATPRFTRIVDSPSTAAQEGQKWKRRA
jgi:MFS transporter, PPP family, 3-phenylpropionic acid transporter